MPPSSSKETQPPPNLLVIDDESASLELVKAMLSRGKKYRIVTCLSGSAGLKMLDEGIFDCIITDAVMPQMSGYDFVKTIRSNKKHAAVPVLMLTRKRNRQDVKMAVEVGVTDYVFKPIDEKLLLEKVAHCLRTSHSPKAEFYTLPGSLAKAEITLTLQLAEISGTGLTFWFPIPVERDFGFSFSHPVFEEIGIPVPRLKWLDCHEAGGGSNSKDLRFEVRYRFEDLTTEKRKKLTSWLQDRIRGH